MIMIKYGARPFESRKRSSEECEKVPAWPPAALLAAVLTFGAFAQDARAKGEIPFSDVSIILETNATDCDTGLQLFFDGEAWRKVKVENPNGKTILDVTAKGPVRGFGLTEQFNETSEPVMAELAAAVDQGQCEDPEFTLEELFELFPEGIYEFGGVTVEGKELEGEATLSHVIPAPPEIVAPMEGSVLNSNLPVIIMWDKVELPIATFPIVPGLGPVTIVGFHVVVERVDPEPLVVFTADLPDDATEVTVPSEFLQPDAAYIFEVLQIDVSGNQTIAQREFETAPVALFVLQ